MNLAEFLVWDPPDGSDRWELINGVPVPRPGVTVGHGRLTINSAVLLHRHIHRPLRAYMSGSVGPDAWNVRTAALIISAEPITRDALLLREPLLIVEIVGPSTAEKISTALPLYRTMPSVREILVLQSTRIEAELWRRQVGGEWTSTALTGMDDVEVDSVGFIAPLAAVYGDALD